MLPLDDLGLRRAIERHYNDRKPLTKDEMREIAREWAPYSSAATWYLWRSLDPVTFCLTLSFHGTGRTFL